MNDIKIIKTTKDISTEWLTKILYDKKVLDKGNVISIGRMPCNQIATSGTLFRLNINYDTLCNGPESIILKLPAMNTSHRKFHIENRFYSREVLFYREFSEMNKGMVPFCYDALWDDDEKIFHILLEDSHKGRTHALMGAGPSIKQTLMIIEWLAKFHAHWWEHPKLMLWEREFSPLQDMNDIRNAVSGGKELWDLIGDWFTESEKELCTETAKMWPLIKQMQQQSPYTLCHGDFHSLNIFVPLDESSENMHTIDWQFSNVGVGVSDLANFLGVFVHPQFRRENQERFIIHYHDCLIKYGVKNYRFDQCMMDYKIQLKKNLLIPFFQKNIPNLPIDAIINCFRNSIATYYDHVGGSKL